jgi:hypothetical protein
MKPFWSNKFGSNKLCAITRTRLRPGRNCKGIPYCIRLKCGHGFYREVILQWITTMKKNNQIPLCPLCRLKICNLN